MSIISEIMLRTAMIDRVLHVIDLTHRPVDNEMGIFTIPSTDEEFMNSMQMLREQNSYDMDDIEISTDSKIVVLATCIDYPRDYDYRYIVVLVRGEELLPSEAEG